MHLEGEFMHEIIEYYIQEYISSVRGVQSEVCCFCSKNGPGESPDARVAHMYVPDGTYIHVSKICPRFVFTDALYCAAASSTGGTLEISAFFKKSHSERYY